MEIGIIRREKDKFVFDEAGRHKHIMFNLDRGIFIL